MKIILEPLNDFDYDNREDYNKFQEELGMDDNFDLADSIIYAMDYGERKDNVIEDRHNDINIRIEV